MLTWKRLLVPSLADALWIALFLWLIFLTSSGGAAGLLADASAGVHLRTGEHVLDQRAVPRVDPYSYSRPHAEWIAWEWLADAMLAVLYRLDGFRAVIVATAAAIATAIWLLLRQMTWRGANPIIAVALVQLGIGAASIHFGVRPSIITVLLLAVAFWLIEIDRRRETAAIWVLPALTALWVNMHPGWIVLPTSLCVLGFGALLERRRERAVRLGSIAMLSMAASLLNPWGWALHSHLYEYLRSDWQRLVLPDFQSPRPEHAFWPYYELLLFASVAYGAWLLIRKRWGDGLLILAWAHASLIAVHNVAVLMFSTLPPLAAELSSAWKNYAASRPRSSVPAILHRIGVDAAPHFERTSAWIPGLLLAFTLLPIDMGWPSDFPGGIYPTDLVARHAAQLDGARIYSTQEWSNYLIHRLPRARTYLDSRGGFFTEEICRNYLRLMNGQYGWEQTFADDQVNYALIPSDSSLASVLAADPRWRLLEDTGDAALFAAIGIENN